MERTIGTATVVAAVDGIGQQDIGGETVILDPRSNTYFGLNATGSAIWRLLQQPTRVEAVVEAIARGYAVDRARCERDVLTLVGELEARGLVEVKA